jgi:hypothetical protein
MVEDVYFLTVHGPCENPGGRAPVNGVIVHALTLLHPELPQPDAGRMYRCLTEFPGRKPGCLVPLSTLDYELDGGRLWPQVADWEAVTGALISLTKTPGRCDSIPLALRPSDTTLLATGPYAHIPVITEEGMTAIGTSDRRQLLYMLTLALPESSGRPSLWPGDNLIPPPEHPATMPYQPHGT